MFDAILFVNLVSFEGKQINLRKFALPPGDENTFILASMVVLVTLNRTPIKTPGFGLTK
jgi:hypothetical protein